MHAGYFADKFEVVTFLLFMVCTIPRIPRLTIILATTMLTSLLGCDKNGQTGVLQHPSGNPALRAEVTPDKAYDQMFDTSDSGLSDSTYLIITKATQGSVFTVHTGPRPTTPYASPASTIPDFGNAWRNTTATPGPWPFSTTKPAFGPRRCNLVVTGMG